MPNTIAIEPTITLDDALWERVTEITGGATSVCYQCGVCTASCPWGQVRDEPINVRQLVRRVQLGLEDGDSDVWLCTSCRQCASLCPRGLDIPEVFRALRSEQWRNNDAPQSLNQVLWNVHWDGNPLGQAPSQRTAWAADLDLPRFDPAAHEVLLYVGCSASYDRRLQKIARALVQILRAANVPFGALGEDEPCCGESVLALGHEAYFAEIASANTERFQAAGVASVVTVSPHCFDAFKTRYEAGEGFQPIHYTQLLDQLIADGRLSVPGDGPGGGPSVTYHDPCYLGRAHGVYEEPRRVLSALPGVVLVEMENNREQALCCGGGGGRLWMDTPVEERFAVVRTREAQATGAQVIATACPACLSCLEDGLKVGGMTAMRVMDIAEIVAESLSPTPGAMVEGGAS